MCLFGNNGFGGDSWIWVLIILFIIIGCGRENDGCTSNNSCINNCGCNNDCDPCC